MRKQHQNEKQLHHRVEELEIRLNQHNEEMTSKFGTGKLLISNID